MNAPLSINPFLAGNFAPVRSEDDYALEVAGEFPSALRAPSTATAPTRSSSRAGHYHWFAGDGMIHALLRRRRQGRLPQPLCPHAEMASGERGGQGAVRRFRPAGGRPLGQGQGQRRRQHQHRLARRSPAGARGRRTCRSSSIPRASSRAATSTSYRGRVTAHPKIDPETGEMIWFGYSVGECRSRRPCPTASPTRTAG